MQSKSFTLYFNQTLLRSILAIGLFAALTAVAARIVIYLPFTPVPISFTPLVVVLSGLVLGSRGGALAQIGYLGMIASGLPFDAAGIGPLAFFGPTAGYLIGYVPAAFVAGWLAERFAIETWWGNFAAAIFGVLTLYLVGATWLASITDSWATAWAAGVAPFILLDLVKAATAAGVTESGKRLFVR